MEELNMQSQTKIKVLFCSFQSNLSGAPRMLYHLVRHLDRSRFEPHVLFPYDGPIVREFRKIAPTHVARSFKGRHLPHPVRWRIREALHRWTLNKLLEQTRPDVLYINTVGQNYIAEWALGLREPKIVHFHEIDNEVMRLPGQWLQRIVTESDLLIGCSHVVSDFIVRCLGAESLKVRTVPESIDVIEIVQRPRRAAGEVKRELGLTADCILIGAVGKPSFRKGADLFIEAAAKVCRMRPDLNVHFAWVGGHEGIHDQFFLHAMRALVARLGLNGRFHWIKEVSDPSSFEAAMDAYIVSSREDPFPLGMLESMLLGTPVIGFAVSGVPEALGHGVGILVERVSSDGLSQAILGFVEKPEFWRKLGSDGRAQVVAHYDIAKNIHQIEKAIVSLT